MLWESVDGAANASRSTVENVGAYHRGLYLAMAQDFLDRWDIGTVPRCGIGLFSAAAVMPSAQDFYHPVVEPRLG